MLIDLAAANELERITAFDLLVEQFQAAVVGVVGVSLDSVICRQISFSAVAFSTSASIETPRDARSEHSTIASAILRMSGSKVVISNSTMAFAVALH